MIDYYKDIILESNLSLKRNIEGYNFPISLSEEDSLLIIEKFKEIYEDELILLEEVDENTLNKLINSGVLSEDCKNKQAIIGLVFKDDYIIVINDTDHISINASNFGLDLKSSFDILSSVEKFLDKKFDFAFSAKYGYLTSFARNTGNGIELKLKMFLFALIDNSQSYLALKSNLAHDGIYFTRFLPYYFKKYNKDIYLLKNYGNYRKDIKSQLEKIEEIVDTLVRNERRFRRDYLIINGLVDDDIKDRVKILKENLKSENLKSLTDMLEVLYDLKKYNILGFNTGLSDVEIDYLIFNLTKNKYKGNRDSERYEFLNSYIKEQ
ncbi:ATP--guanido phosphotransferase [Anaerococcus sp. AGMB00486]|uniref:ATP--guanido phosphotransferase n=2 Tax=Anaerococcus TaxID=165779 RepID=A0ABX2NBT4_9FIRM|nr:MULTISPECIES: ATP--guanido phosphotransferase [Anaerococcus]MDY3006337.1 ATP--guanido phosphotransferase [Anaerococcus porci]MSS78764.1 ATP--guanido phosphotransferase [Anaerococcus porci]NVF12154.1 ATP--guanido phosphotransferase [Anaerococcus faecalis]